MWHRAIAARRRVATARMAVGGTIGATRVMRAMAVMRMVPMAAAVQATATARVGVDGSVVAAVGPTLAVAVALVLRA